MRIYKVQRKMRNVDYDEYDSVVVKARNEANAIQLAWDFAYGFSEKDVEITEVHLDDVEEVVLGSFNAG